LYRPRAWIVNIGNELLVGRIVNSNGAWIAKELTLRGVNVKRILVIPDSIDDIAVTVRDAVSNADVIVTTGGLGPTDDDITIEGIAAGLSLPLVLNEQALLMVREFYAKRGLPLTRERVKMAYLVKDAEPIPNPVGAAPGMYVNYRGVHLFSLPGVPREMEAMFPWVLQKLEPILPKLCVREKGLTIEGVPESTLAPLVRRAASLCDSCYVKTHPLGHETQEPKVEVKVLASAERCEEAEALANKVLEAVAREVDKLETG
jgi:molybdenum cofactor synthesis domain-containing protein